MPQVIYTEESKQDLVRFANFLVANEAKEQARAVVTVILSHVKKLEEFPLIGRIYPIENKEFRELKIKYGSSGYVCLYSFDPMTDIVFSSCFQASKGIRIFCFLMVLKNMERAYLADYSSNTVIFLASELDL